MTIKTWELRMDGIEFLFLMMGYGLGILEYADPKGWVIILFSISVMVFSLFYKWSFGLKVVRET